MTDPTIEQRVAAGAEWLDSVLPGWERRIDLATLDMSNGCRCVLGQAVTEAFNAAGGRRKGDTPYCYAWRTLRWPHSDDLATQALGFYSIRHGRTEYPKLEAAWAALIKQRFDTGTLSDGGEQ